MNMTENEPVSPADDLIQKYEALTKAAGRILYPKSSIITESWPDTQQWGWFKKLLFYFDKPFLPSISRELNLIPVVTVFLRLISFHLLVVIIAILANWNEMAGNINQPEGNFWPNLLWEVLHS
jgi:hypothetical protein